MTELDSDAETFQRPLRISRKVVGEACQNTRPCLDQHDAGHLRIDVAEVGRQGVAREFRDGSGKLDTRRTGADDDESQQCGSPLWICLAFRKLKGEQNASANGDGVLDGLKAGCEGFPCIVTEIRVPGPGCENESVILQVIPAIEQNAAFGHIDAGYLREQYGRVSVSWMMVRMGQAISEGARDAVAA